MGLDQYLQFTDYSVDPEPKDGLKRISVSYELAYFRKFAPLQNWIENYYPGFDNCDTIELDPEVLENLRSDCWLVLNGIEKPEDVFDSTGRFFWGSEEFDEYFFEKLRELYKALGKALELLKDNAILKSVKYHANW